MVANSARQRKTRRTHRITLLAIASVGVTLFSGAYWGCGEYPPGPAEAPDYSNPSTAGTAASACGDKRKPAPGRAPLANIWNAGADTWAGTFGLFKYTVYTSWGYRPNMAPCSNPGYINWRHSEPVFEPNVALGSVQLVKDRWYETYCFDNGRQCLTRRDIRVQWSVGFKGLAFNGYKDGCITTRIGPGGNHWRHVYDNESCAQVLGRALARAGRKPSPRLRRASAVARRVDRRVDHNDATIEDYVGRQTASRIERVCSTRGLKSVECHHSLWDAYTSLSPAMQAQAAQEMSATAVKSR